MTDFQTENNQESIQIMVAEDQLSASVWIQQGESHYTAALLKNRLSEAGVTSGLQEETIQQLANGLLYDQWVVVAKGTPCVNGEDGWYEYAFHRETDHKPKILEDGSVDYSQYGNIPSVKEGDVIAVYHPATVWMYMVIFWSPARERILPDYSEKVLRVLKMDVPISLIAAVRSWKPWIRSLSIRSLWSRVI